MTRLAALAQDSRLAVFRFLVQLGPAGARPGQIAEALDLSPSTLSFHLKALAHAGLVEAEPDGRSIVYRADFAVMQGLVDFLTDNCCAGNPEACVPGRSVGKKLPAGTSAAARSSARRPSPRRRTAST